MKKSEIRRLVANGEISNEDQETMIFLIS